MLVKWKREHFGNMTSIFNGTEMDETPFHQIVFSVVPAGLLYCQSSHSVPSLPVLSDPSAS